MPHYNIVAYGFKLRKMDEDTIRRKAPDILAADFIGDANFLRGKFVRRDGENAVANVNGTEVLAKDGQSFRAVFHSSAIKDKALCGNKSKNRPT